MTGAAIEPTQYAARDPKGRAIIKGAEYVPPPEEPDDEYPFLLTTGRVTYHFHTRTKTARSPALQAAAPEAFVEIADVDAVQLGIEEGDAVEVVSRRGRVVVPARLTGVEPGVVFIPWHYGDDSTGELPTAANRLTITGWDLVSKQPHFKYAAVTLRPVRPPTESDTAGAGAALAGSNRDRTEPAVPAPVGVPTASGVER
jgi:ferredoxin-nitrate reductase